VSSFFSYVTHIFEGESTPATPNGRLCCEPVSNGMGPEAGKDENGLTALMNTILKMDHSKLTGAFVLNARLSDSFVKNTYGVDALLCVTPYYNKANEEGMIRHFTTVADQVSAPVILYNVPGRTGCGLSVSAVERLSKHPNIMGIKEASGNISYAVSVSRFLSDDFVMYSGNDDMIVPILSLGGSGVISVFANTNPKEAHDITAKWFAGDHAGSLALQQKYLDYIHALFCEVNPIPVKEALNAMGMQVGGYRLPLYEMAEKNKEILYGEMRKVGLL
jgi:4-hydroxy-tetrahydrodipicolinate synthase